jgi:hypothetical protein
MLTVADIDFSKFEVMPEKFNAVRKASRPICRYTQILSTGI